MVVVVVKHQGGRTSERASEQNTTNRQQLLSSSGIREIPARESMKRLYLRAGSWSCDSACLSVRSLRPNSIHQRRRLTSSVSLACNPGCRSLLVEDCQHIPQTFMTCLLPGSEAGGGGAFSQPGITACRTDDTFSGGITLPVYLSKQEAWQPESPRALTSSPAAATTPAAWCCVVWWCSCRPRIGRSSSAPMRVDVYIKVRYGTIEYRNGSGRRHWIFLLLLVFLSLAGFLPLFTPSSSFFPNYKLLLLASSSRAALACVGGLCPQISVSRLRGTNAFFHIGPVARLAAGIWEASGVLVVDGRGMEVSISLSGFSLDGI